MKRFHLHVGVKNLEKSIRFYSILFGQKPSKVKNDYAKWMIEDPKINFAISTRVSDEGVDHLGIQVENDEELKEITSRLRDADMNVYNEGDSTCCYAKSKKIWVQDPSGVAWEAYQTMNDVEVFSSKTEKSESEDSSCCVPNEAGSACC